MEWSVDVEARVGQEVDSGMIDDILERLGDHGVALSYSHDGSRMSLRLNVDTDDGGKAFLRAAELVRALPYALSPVGGRVQTVEDLERELDEAAVPELVGVAEVAEALQVSKARVNELQDLPAFPEPVARLKSGPVWTRASLGRFLDTWQRKPGRPRKQPGQSPPSAGISR